MKIALNSIRFILLAGLISQVLACATAPIDYQQKLQGKWETLMAGSPVIIEFTDTSVNVLDGLYINMTSPYQIEGDLISYDFQGPQTGRMEIISDNEIIQTNTVTQEVMKLIRHN